MGTPNQLYLTWTQIYAQLQASELDLSDTLLANQSQVQEWFNQGIRKCQAKIHTIYEDYFLTRAASNLALVSGADTITLPTNIYAGKLRGLVYTNGAIIYSLHRLKEWHKFIEYRLLRLTPNSAMRYHYFLVNNSAGAQAIVISPPAQENGTFLECWYIRRANEMTTGTDVCDIPEFVQYPYDYVRVKLYEKEGHPMLPVAQADLAETDRLMIETLTEMVPDHDNRIEPDMSTYLEHS